MVSSIRQIFLTLLVACSSAHSIQVGDKVPDFVLPASDGWAQRLSEQVGHPVMLIWLDQCDGCEERLIDWQYLAESHAEKGLVTWFIFKPDGDEQSTNSRIPLLEYHSSNAEGWWFDPAPSVMFISPDGKLDQLYLKDIDGRRAEIAGALKNWLDKRSWLTVSAD